MHVYLRDEQVRLRMEEVDGSGLVPDGSDLVPTAFYAADNDHPSFRALLPPETVEVLREALEEPVTLGVLAEEPQDPAEEIRAMVGLAVPIDEADMPEQDEEQESEPWRASAGSSEAWRGEGDGGYEDAAPPRTALLAFAPLVRIRRRFPADFGEELADLLEAALSGLTKPALEARVDRMLDDL
jgi:hypothetical protein